MYNVRNINLIIILLCVIYINIEKTDEDANHMDIFNLVKRRYIQVSKSVYEHKELKVSFWYNIYHCYITRHNLEMKT